MRAFSFPVSAPRAWEAAVGEGGSAVTWPRGWLAVSSVFTAPRLRRSLPPPSAVEAGTGLKAGRESIGCRRHWWDPLNHRITESLRLEKTSKVIKSNRQPSPTMPAKPWVALGWVALGWVALGWVALG